MELGVNHEQSLSSSTPIVDNTFDKYNKNLVPIRSLSGHDTKKSEAPALPQEVEEEVDWLDAEPVEILPQLAQDNDNNI